MRNKTIRFFDFDETLTIKHTFRTAGLDCESLEDSNHLQQHFEARGLESAKINMKEKVGNICKHDDVEYTSSIVTYHNNPFFIAGFMSGLFEKKMIFMKELPADKNALFMAYEYQVEGITNPFLICCRKPSEEHTPADRKNSMITFTRNCLLEKGTIAIEDTCEFYDDDHRNIIEAWDHLPFIQCYDVSRESPYFQSHHYYQMGSDGLPATPKWKSKVGQASSNISSLGFLRDSIDANRPSKQRSCLEGGYSDSRSFGL